MKTAAPAIREKDLREQIRSLVKLFGWRMAFTQYSLRSPKGFPDLVLVRPPRLIFAELKSEIGKTTPEQDVWLADLTLVAKCVALAAGRCCFETEPPDTADRHLHITIVPASVEVYLWRPHDIETIAQVLR